MSIFLYGSVEWCTNLACDLEAFMKTVGCSLLTRSEVLPGTQTGICQVSSKMLCFQWAGPNFSCFQVLPVAHFLGTLHQKRVSDESWSLDECLIWGMLGCSVDVSPYGSSPLWPWLRTVIWRWKRGGRSNCSDSRWRKHTKSADGPLGKSIGPHDLISNFRTGNPAVLETICLQVGLIGSYTFTMSELGKKLRFPFFRCEFHLE